jgi:hypothetical protein
LLRVGRALAHRPAELFAGWARAAEVPLLQLDLPFVDYGRLVESRSRARSLGVHVPDPYAPPILATLTYGELAGEASIRLTPGPVAPGEGWRLTLTVEGEARRLLLRPADAGFLVDWGYLGSLRREGLAAAEVALVRLVLNGDDLGLYVREERPGAASLDAERFWAARARLGERLPGAGFQYAGVRDPSLEATSVRGWLAGEVPPSTLFDARALGRFLALTTLWHGTPAPEWTTLQLDCPSGGGCAPLGVGQGSASAPPLPLPHALDVEVGRAYARALEEFSRPEYLEALRAGSLGEELESFRLALSLDDPGAPWDAVDAHRRAMRALLNPETPVSFEVASSEGGLQLQVTNLHPLPLEVVGLELGESAVVPYDRAWSSAGADPLVLPPYTGGPLTKWELTVPPESLRAGEVDEVALLLRPYGLEGGEIRVVAEPAVGRIP